MSRRLLAKLILLLIVAFGVYAAASPSQFYPLYMVGHIDIAQDLTISINDGVLPFDLEDSVVAENPNPSASITGLQIGSYSMFSNDENFTLIITHTPLVLNGTKAEETQFDSIDYRLYAVVNKKIADPSLGFKSCLSDENADESTALAANYISVTLNDVKARTNSMISLVDHALYVSLEDKNRGGEYATTASVIENLSPGYYSSTLYFFLIGS